MIRFCPLFSSSSGNSVYIGAGSGGILVDVGRSAKQTREMLNNIGVDESSVKAVFITHEHSDHIKGLCVFAAKNSIPVYAAPGTLLSLKKSGVLDGRTADFTIDENGAEIAGMIIKPFRTSHDCADGRGYVVTDLSDGASAAVATDTGFVTAEMLAAVTGCGLVYIESNHDIQMLKCGPYPPSLQQRILSNIGHLSNDACATALKTLVNKGTTQIVLAHLSEENNTPELARETSVSALAEMGALCGRDYLLDVARPVSGGKTYMV